MEQIKNILKEREKFLIQLKNQKEKSLIAVPEGSLRVSSHNNRTQYYHRKDPKDFSGIYIREEDRHVAKKLAQKDYDKRVVHAAEKELKAISKYLINFPDTSAEQIYGQLHKERQKLITPIKETEEQFIQTWENISYQGKGFEVNTPEFYTAKGERVRSKSEVIIADILNREGIPYRYEYPIYLSGIGKVYPDFTVLNVKMRKEMFWEHLGMMDDATYVEKAIRKIKTYELNRIFPGENLILTYETRQNPVNQKLITLLIQNYLKKSKG